MPAKYRRIAVVEDPELAEAMRKASGILERRSAASLLRELAIQGAAALDAESRTSPRMKRILEIPGTRTSSGDWRHFLKENPPLALPVGSDPYSVSKALKEQREDRD